MGFSYVAPFAMVPDVIEYEAAKTGERKEGAYYGVWTFTSKLGTALALFVTGHILEWGGYIAIAGGGAIQPPEVFYAIRIIIGPIPIAVLLGAAVLINFYPLDKKAVISEKS